MRPQSAAGRCGWREGVGWRRSAVLAEAEGARRRSRNVERGERQALETDGVGVALFFFARPCTVRLGVGDGLQLPGQMRQRMRMQLDLQAEQGEDQDEQKHLAGMSMSFADAAGESSGVQNRQDESTQPGARPDCGCGAGHRRILGGVLP